MLAACSHLPSRREALIGSGALFAWTQLPRLARAEGRDPRMLVIVLRGALDGLGAVAPVGDPDWIGLRGDRALVLDGRTPALPLDGFFALNPAMPNLHRLYKAGHAIIVHATATPYRERSHFDGQDVLESGLARPGTVDTGWLNRALQLARLRRPRRSGRRPRLCRGPGDAAGGARAGARDVVGAAAAAAGHRRHPGAPAGALPSHRSETRGRARGTPAARCAGACRWHGRAERGSAAAARHRPRARLLRRGRGHGRALPRPLRWPARRRHGLRGLGHPHQRGCGVRAARRPARGARRRDGRDRDQHGRGLARDGGGGRHRVRAHGAHQRHRRHGPRHRRRRLPRRRRAQGRARDRRLARLEARQSVRSARPEADHRSARRPQGPAARTTYGSTGACSPAASSRAAPTLGRWPGWWAKARPTPARPPRRRPG